MGLGRLHVVLVHFPIALALAAVAAELLWLATRRAFFQHAAAYCLFAAAIMAIPVVITGGLRIDSMHYTGSYAEIAEDHAQMGTATLGTAIAAATVRLVRRRWPGKWLLALYVLLMAALAVCVSVTGHLGGQLDHGENYLSNLF